MFEFIKKIFSVEAQPHVKEAIESKLIKPHELDWINPSESDEKFRFLKKLNPDDYLMVGEPVLTLIALVKEGGNRFKISFMEMEEYLVHNNIYHWMNDRQTRFGTFEDTKTGVVKTFTIHEGELYHVDGLDFTLNHWEKLALQLCFLKYRYKAKERKYQMRQSRKQRELNERRNYELKAREKMAKLLRGDA